MKTLKITSIKDYNEWKEIMIHAKELGLTTDYIRYNLALFQKEKEKESSYQ